MSQPGPSDRRQHPRRSVVRPCKVRDRRTLLFSAGLTSDVSEGGALIRIDRARPLGAGDELDVVVAWSGAGVIASDSMLRGRVTRVMTLDERHQAVALEFLAPATALEARAA